MDFDPYEELANAIVLFAKEDYIESVQLLRGKYGDTMSISDIKAAVALDIEERKAALAAENILRKEQKIRAKRFRQTRYDKAVDRINEVEKFIGSSWYYMLTDLDASVMRAHLREIGG